MPVNIDVSEETRRLAGIARAARESISGSDQYSLSGQLRIQCRLDFRVALRPAGTVADSDVRYPRFPRTGLPESEH